MAKKKTNTTQQLSPERYIRTKARSLPTRENKLKERLKKEGNESVTNYHQQNLLAADGKGFCFD